MLNTLQTKIVVNKYDLKIILYSPSSVKYIH